MGYFRGVRKTAKKKRLLLVALLCLSVRPQGTARLPLKGLNEMNIFPKI
jgi:hypothetical protein